MIQARIIVLRTQHMENAIAVGLILPEVTKTTAEEHLEELKGFLSGIKPMTSVFDQGYVKKLTATHAKTGKSKMDLAEQVIADIENFRKKNG